MQRLSSIPDQEATGTAAEVMAAATKFLGRTANLTRILAKHSPYTARWFVGFVSAVRQPNLGASTDVRVRNLATIKTSMANACAYCTAHTSIYGQALGVSDKEIAELQNDSYKTSPLFSEREKAAIAWAEAMTLNTAKLNNDIWKDMRRLFSDTEIVEISLNVGMFNMVNRLNDSFWTELESEEYNRQQGNAVSGRTIEQLEDYAAHFGAVRIAEQDEGRRKVSA